MNAFEGSKKLYQLSEDLMKLSEKLSNTTRASERVLVEKEIDRLEIEFFTIKHRLEKTKIDI